ncbi:septum formation initiator family protein [Candidatus Parcubacteria bacterium]|nr:septum formation initiator family protein [Candidatus Parcubacteria bacterium]
MSTIFHPITISLFGILILASVSLSLAKKYSQRYEVSREVKGLQKEIAQLEEKNSELKYLMEYLQTDQFVEEQARVNLNYRKEGEAVAVIKDEQTGFNVALANTMAGNKARQNTKLNNLQKWWQYFFNNNIYE